MKSGTAPATVSEKSRAKMPLCTAWEGGPAGKPLASPDTSPNAGADSRRERCGPVALRVLRASPTKSSTNFQGDIMHSRFISGQLAATHQLVPAISAIALGFALVLFIGFATVPEVHNAAHDTRHSAAFPCH